MATSIVWSISQLDCSTTDPNPDTVVTAHWQCTGTQDEYSAQVYGTAGFTLEQGAGFTPYADLTQDQVLGWVWTSVDKDATEANVTAQLENQINPPIVTPPLPWAPAPELVEA